LKRSSDGGQSWQTVRPDFRTGWCIVTPGGALECLDVDSSPSIESFSLGRSDDHGAPWREIFAQGVCRVVGGGVRPTDGSIVYAVAGIDVVRSTDDGLTFQIIPNSPQVGRLQVLANGHLLTAFQGGSGGYRSIDQGATWQKIDRSTVLPVVEEGSG